MTRAEKHHIDIAEVVAVGKHLVGVAEKPPVHIADGVTGIAGGVNPRYFGLRMVEQQADKFSGCVAGASDDASANHWPLRF